MTLELELTSVHFADGGLGVHWTRTQDGQVLSVLFDHMKVDSGVKDGDVAPEVQHAEGSVRCIGSGFVTVQVRGATIVTGMHGYAHATGWANGRRLRAAPGPSDEPFVMSTVAPVSQDGQLRLSLLLLAQRDLLEPNSAAACWIDSIDIVVVPEPRSRPDQVDSIGS